MQEIPPGLWRWTAPHPARPDPRRPNGGLRLCPESWLYWVSVDRSKLRSLLEPLLELPIERVVVSHGELVLHDGVKAVRRCLSNAVPR